MRTWLNFFLFTYIALTLSSCNFLDRDQQTKFSYNEPFFLGLNEVVVKCSGSTIESTKEWNQLFNQNLSDYRKDSYSYDFQGQVASKESICSLLSFYERTPDQFSSFSQNKRLATWMNIYHLMIINLVVENFSEVNEIGQAQLPQFRSLLNIKTKGIALFDEFQWFIFGQYRSLNDIEKEIEAIAGLEAKISLYRGMNGFGPLPKLALTENTVLKFIGDSLKEVVNESIFYDDGSSPFAIVAPGSLRLYLESGIFSEFSLREILFEYLDEDSWSDILNRTDLLKKNQDIFLWQFDYDPINWQLSE